jgi:hypothetical protein
VALHRRHRKLGGEGVADEDFEVIAIVDVAVEPRDRHAETIGHGLEGEVLEAHLDTGGDDLALG